MAECALVLHSTKEETVYKPVLSGLLATEITETEPVLPLYRLFKLNIQEDRKYRKRVAVLNLIRI